MPSSRPSGSDGRGSNDLWSAPVPPAPVSPASPGDPFEHLAEAALRARPSGPSAPVPLVAPDDPLMRLPEVALYAGVSLTTVRRWHYNRQLHTFYLGRSVYVRRSEVDRVLAEAETQWAQ